jgi:sugar O-acyltransferase (sialic acid O-acetyltransferase NeuD family)
LKPVILLGSGGHARVVLAALRRQNSEIIGLVDPNLAAESEYLNLKVLGADKAVFDYQPDQIELVNGIGSIPGDTGLRCKLFNDFQQRGYRFKTLIDNSVLFFEDVEIGEGSQLMPGVIIQCGTKIASNSIINTGAIIEHDCRIGSHVHVAPGSVLCGAVEIGDKVHIGAGATVIQGIRIGSGSVIGAGCIVTREVGSKQILYPPRAQLRDMQ